jgi:hypothetical protein
MRTVRKISRKDLSHKNDAMGYFLAGFTEGEGSFNVSLRKKDDYTLKWQVVMSFNVSQKDPSLLRLLQTTLDCGIIKIRKRDGLFSFDVTNPGDIIIKVIPFFQKYPLVSKTKKRNFRIFCLIAGIMENGGHKKIVGLHKIVRLREKLNPGISRKRKYNISDVIK